ncbi:hypothetical protein GCM10023238_37120 [Streptomyces heliomycini]
MTKYRLVSRGGARPTKENPGYIDVATAGRALTYYGEQERFDKQVIGEWWRGGDVGYRTKWGCLHLLDGRSTSSRASTPPWRSRTRCCTSWTS